MVDICSAVDHRYTAGHNKGIELIRVSALSAIQSYRSMREWGGFMREFVQVMLLMGHLLIVNMQFSVYDCKPLSRYLVFHCVLQLTRLD